MQCLPADKKYDMLFPKGGVTVRRQKFLFYFLSFTWGLPLTLAGLLTALALTLCGKKSRRWGWCRWFAVGHHWGGLEFGPIFLTDREAPERLRNHELGHAMQNCIFGPLSPLLINIPSAVRYWIFRLRGRWENYDRIWFEGQATRLGTELMEKLTAPDGTV